MKVSCHASRFHGGQIDRIEAGFVALGHELTPHTHEADLIYANDPGHFEQIREDKHMGRIRGKVVFNVLDIPHHIPDFDTVRLAAQLRGADAVTSISKWTQHCVIEDCGVASEVIYNPIKPVTYKPQPRRWRFAHIGRRWDRNKFSSLANAAVHLLGFTEKDLALVGSEGGWGDIQGVLSDENLNKVYNSVDFVLAPSLNEGLCLPVLESMAAGVIPVVCRDMTTRIELLPPGLFPEYEDVERNASSVARFVTRFIDSPERMADMKTRLLSHYRTEWAAKVSGTGVARSITVMYDKLISSP